MHALLDGFVRRRMQGATGWHVEKFAAGSVHVMLEVQNAFIRTVGGLKQHGARAVAEQNARRAVPIVENCGHHVAAEDHDFFVRPRTDELRADRERIRKPRARGGKVETPGALRADAALHQARGCGKKHVRRNTGQDNQVDVRRIRFGLCEQRFRSFRGQMRTGHAFFHDVALADAGARANPLVAGLDDFLEIRVGHHFRRNVAGNARDFCRDAVGHVSP